jgi:transcriptional regulator with XRE-family HTH domain
MADLETPGEALARVRAERGWTYFEAGRRANVGDQQIKNLEHGKTAPGDVKAITLLRLVAAYWPDLALVDLVEDSPFQLLPKSDEAATVLASRSSSKSFLSRVRAMGRAFGG